MNAKKSLLVAGVVSSIALTGIAGVGAVSAASESSNADGSTSLVDKIASKFNLKKADVQAVFDANRSEHQAKHQAKFEERLTQAVQDGKITEDQKTKIIAKAKELQTTREANRDAMKDKTAEERKAAMDAERTALEQWAKDNGIPSEFAHFGMGGHGRGHGMGARMGDQAPADQ